MYHIYTWILWGCGSILDEFVGSPWERKVGNHHDRGLAMRFDVVFLLNLPQGVGKQDESPEMFR